VTGDTFLVMTENTALLCVPVGTVVHLECIPPHFSQDFLSFLDWEFPDYWIGRGDQLPGPLVLRT
jgi:hypothetical protein